VHRRQATDDDMIVTDLARMYPTATGRALQRAIVEGSPHIHERKAGHVDDDTRRVDRQSFGGNWTSLNGDINSRERGADV